MAVGWVGAITKFLGPIGQFFLKNWLFRVEPIGGDFVVYTFERGDSPYVGVWLSVRVHNRNNSPTTLWAERLTVKLDNRTDDDFPLPAVHQYGDLDSLFDGSKRIEIGGSSTLEVAFSSRKWYTALPGSYLSGGPLEATIGVAETFGNHREVRTQLVLKEVVRQ